MANATEQESQKTHAYFTKLLAALKQLKEFIGLEAIVEQTISATENLQAALKENVLDKVPKNFEQVVDAMHRLRQALETLTEEKRSQAVQLFAFAHEACLNLSKDIQMVASSKYQLLKASALDAAASVDLETCIAALKYMQTELVHLKTEKQQKLFDLLAVAVVQATVLHAHLSEQCQSHFHDTVEAVSKIRESLAEVSSDRKEKLLEAYATCQEALLSLTSRLRFGETFASLKDHTFDAAVHLDVENAVAALKNLVEEVKSLDRNKLTIAVALAYEKATDLQKSLQDGVSDKATKYYSEAVASLHQVRISLQDTASEKKAAALLMYTTAQDAFVHLAQKVRAAEKGHILHSIKDRALETAIFLDDRYSLWQKVQAYTEAALLKSKVVLENERVIGAIDLARSLDDKIAQGTVNSVVGKGYGIVEAGAVYLKDEVQAARQRQAQMQTQTNGPSHAKTH
eukprot:GEMP01010423.1.p1 GENE.GEMP01010423.1~~GEMP01010423.1.p1  ORF type:complete len:458 (+),score=150.00 GEMP01010423.1:70-1443(+)